jgi:hypothetical protein
MKPPEYIISGYDINRVNWAFSLAPRSSEGYASEQMPVVRSVLSAWLALVSVVSITTAANFLPHTDDGCGIEVHCLACSTAVGQAATAATVVIVSAPGSSVESLSVNIPHAPLPPDVEAADPRGPPLH